MKKIMCMFFVVIMCLGFVGCKEEESSQFAEMEKATQQVEETKPSVEIPPASAPVEIQPQEAQEVAVEKITGMISDIMPDIGQITIVEKESDKTVTLTAGPDVDLQNFNVGDHVVVEYSQNIVISINKVNT